MQENEKASVGMRHIEREFQKDCYGLTSLELPPGGVFFDVGANVGTFSIVAAILFPTARVVAFEPQPSTYANLVANLAANGVADRVTALNYGLAAGDGTRDALLFDANTGGSSSYRSRQRWAMQQGRHVSIQSRTVAQALVEAHLAPGSPISYLKLDCEGCEYEIFSSLPWASIRLFSFELHTKFHEDRMHPLVASPCLLTPPAITADTLLAAMQCLPHI